MIGARDRAGKAWWIRNPVFPRADVFLICGPELNAWLVSEFGVADEFDKSGNGQFNSLTSRAERVYYIWLRKGDRLETASHEISHLVDNIIDDLGLDPGVDGTETRAYLTSFYYGEVKKCLNGAVKQVKLKKGREKR